MTGIIKEPWRHNASVRAALEKDLEEFMNHWSIRTVNAIMDALLPDQPLKDVLGRLQNMEATSETSILACSKTLYEAFITFEDNAMIYRVTRLWIEAHYEDQEAAQ